MVQRIQNQVTRTRPSGPNTEQAENIQGLAMDLVTRIQLKMEELKAEEGITAEVTKQVDPTKERLSLIEQILSESGKEYDQVAELTQLYTDMSMAIRNGLVNAIEGAINGTRTLGEVASAVFGQIQRSLIQYGVNAFLGSLGGGIGEFFSLSGRSANGGAALRGSSYLVGERGPEIFTPSSSGMVSPNIGGGTNIVVNVDASGSNVQGDDQRAGDFGRVLASAIQSELIRQQRPGGLLA